MRDKTQNASSELVVWVVLFVVVPVAGWAADQPNRSAPDPVTFKQWTLSAGSTFFKYEEPGVMSEEGYLHGISGNYIHGRAGDLGIEWTFELWNGGLDYEGATFGDTPITTNTDDTIFKLAVKGGQFIDASSGIWFPYGGLGYRFWDDVIEGSSQSVETTRKIEYLYLPLGVRYDPRMRGPWFARGRLETQILFSGDVTFQNQYKMSQDGGYGGRFEFSLNRALPRSGQIGVKVFTQYWDIEQSDLSDQTININGTAFSLVEPANSTTMYGLKFTMDF